MLDLTGAKLVEVEVSKDRRVLWVNVDGLCRLRVCQIDTIEFLQADEARRTVISQCIDFLRRCDATYSASLLERYMESGLVNG
jgi:hypothetical protein